MPNSEKDYGGDQNFIAPEKSKIATDLTQFRKDSDILEENFDYLRGLYPGQ